MGDGEGVYMYDGIYRGGWNESVGDSGGGGYMY